tara:strand:+ start:45 stop:275 length:231 start_codon:yes stop_codon:yes gene_type:complete
MDNLEFLQNLLNAEKIKTLEKIKENLLYKKVLKNSCFNHSITIEGEKYKLLMYKGIPCISCESKKTIYYAETHKLK